MATKCALSLKPCASQPDSPSPRQGEQPSSPDGQAPGWPRPAGAAGRSAPSHRLPGAYPEPPGPARARSARPTADPCRVGRTRVRAEPRRRDGKATGRLTPRSSGPNSAQPRATSSGRHCRRWQGSCWPLGRSVRMKLTSMIERCMSFKSPGSAASCSAITRTQPCPLGRHSIGGVTLPGSSTTSSATSCPQGCGRHRGHFPSRRARTRAAA